MVQVGNLFLWNKKNILLILNVVVSTCVLQKVKIFLNWKLFLLRWRRILVTLLNFLLDERFHVQQNFRVLMLCVDNEGLLNFQLEKRFAVKFIHKLLVRIVGLKKTCHLRKSIKIGYFAVRSHLFLHKRKVLIAACKILSPRKELINDGSGYFFVEHSKKESLELYFSQWWHFQGPKKVDIINV